MKFETNRYLGEQVCIDGDDSLRAVVTGVLWKSSGDHQIEVSWIHNGTANSAWFADHRLKKLL